MKAGVSFERLHQVGRNRFLEQRGHRAVRFEIARAHGLSLAGVGNNDIAEAFLEVVEVLGEAENRHHFRGNGDIEAGLAGIAVGDATKRTNDLAQGTVVHVHDAPPHDAARVDAE